MTTMINELYDALRKAGVDDDIARRAAQAVLSIEDRNQFVTKDFLRAELSDLQAKIYRAMLIQTFALAALISALKIFG